MVPKSYLKCDQCSYKSEWDFALKHHLDHHRITPKSLQMFDCTEEPKKYECIGCDYRTTLSTQLIEHIQSEHQKKALPLPLINMVVYSDDVKLSPFCLSGRRRKPRKSREMELREGESSADVEMCVELKCFNCDFMKFSEMFLVKHTQPECKPKFIKVEEWSDDEEQGMSESIRRVVQLHKQLGKNVIIYQFKCLHCFQEYDDNMRAIELLKSMQTYKCYHCSHETPNKMSLKDHIENMHMDPEKIVWLRCEYCDFKTRKKDQLQRHLDCTHGELRQFPCHLCPYRAKYKNHLQCHIFNKHVAIRMFPCDYCEYRAKTKMALSYHTRTQHVDSSQVTWIQCEECSYKARYRHQLKLHVYNRHLPPEEITWYPCSYCEYKAKRTAHLRLHVEKIHMREVLGLPRYTPAKRGRKKTKKTKKGKGMRIKLTATKNKNAVKNKKAT